MTAALPLPGVAPPALEYLGNLLDRVVSGETALIADAVDDWGWGEYSFTADGWTLTFHFRRGTATYLDRAESPEGIVVDFDDWFPQDSRGARAGWTWWRPGLDQRLAAAIAEDPKSMTPEQCPAEQA